MNVSLKAGILAATAIAATLAAASSQAQTPPRDANAPYPAHPIRPVLGDRPGPCWHITDEEKGYGYYGSCDLPRETLDSQEAEGKGGL